MTTSDDLFQLIKSLNKSEKAYFKKFAQLHILGEENTYVLLFNAIDYQEKYDEKTLAKTFAAGKSPSQFSVLKNYLYNLILKSQRVYHTEVSLRSELRAQLQNTALLFEKGLHSQAEKLLRRCRKTAEEAELFRELIEISGIEQAMLLFGKSYDDGTIKIMNAMLDERTHVLLKMQNTYDYDRLEYNLAHNLQKAKAAGRKEIEKIMDHTLMKNEKEALCVISRLKFHHIRSTFCYYTGKREECTRHLQKVLDVLEQHPAILNLRMQDYVLITNNVLLLLLELNKLKKFDAQLVRFRKRLAGLKISTRLWEQAVAQNWLTEMQRHYNDFNYTKILQTADDLKARLKTNKAELTLTDGFQHVDILSRAALKAGKPSDALSFNLELINHPEAPKKFNNYPYARLLNLLIHFELGNYDLLAYSIQSFQRQIMKVTPAPLFDAVISFLKKFPSTTERRQRQELVETLVGQLKLIGAGKADSYFDFISWAQKLGAGGRK